MVRHHLRRANAALLEVLNAVQLECVLRHNAEHAAHVRVDGVLLAVAFFIFTRHSYLQWRVNFWRAAAFSLPATCG